MKILLADDSARHRRAGARDLTALGHEVVAVSTYGEARQRVQRESFDVALLDLLMPAEPTTLSTKAVQEHVGRLIGVGFLLLLELSAYGIPKLAVATDAGHHDHPMSAIVDWFIGARLDVNGARALIMYAPMCVDGVKNWVEVLNRLIAD